MVAAVLILLTPTTVGSSIIPARIGQPLANLTLTDSNGQIQKLTDYSGKVVLLNIWATWCPPCRSEMPDLQAFYSANQAKGFVVLAINAGDARQDVLDFAKTYRLNFQILLDPTVEWVKRMGIYDYPTSILINRDGIVKTIHVGIYTPAALKSDIDPLLIWQ